VVARLPRPGLRHREGARLLPPVRGLPLREAEGGPPWPSPPLLAHRNRIIEANEKIMEMGIENWVEEIRKKYGDSD